MINNMDGTFKKEVVGKELFIYNAKGELIFKRWLDHKYSKVFDIMTYDSDTLVSITDDNIKKKSLPNSCK